MSEQVMSRVYKIKMDGLQITTTVDSAYAKPDGRPDTVDIASARGLHRHAIYELFFVDEEPFTVFLEEETKTYTNCLVCIPPFLSHTTCRDTDLKFMFSFTDKENSGGAFAEFMHSFFDANRLVCGKSSEALKVYIREFWRSIYQKNTLSDAMAQSFLSLIFYELYNCNGVMSRVDSQELCDSYLCKIDVLMTDIRRKITLQSVADALGLSTKQTSRIIRKNYKTTLSDLVTQRRLSVACALLTRSRMSVADIAEDVHFPSVSYFFAQFKKTYGCTPLQYRKNNMKQ